MALGKFEHRFSPAYSPAGNLVERFHRNLTKLLTIDLEQTDCNWLRKLPAIQLAYNSRVHAATGVTPALAFLGREVKIPIALMVPEPGYQSQHSLISNLQERYSLIFKKMYASQTDINRTNTAMYTNRTAPLKVGDLVYHWTKRQVPGKPDKITNRWTGLFQVVEVLNNICVKIDSIHKPGQPVLTTIHHLHKYEGHNSGHYNNPRPDLAPGYPPEDEVETFLGSTEVSRPLGLGTQPQARPRASPPAPPLSSPPLGSTPSFTGAGPPSHPPSPPNGEDLGSDAEDNDDWPHSPKGSEQEEGSDPESEPDETPGRGAVPEQETHSDEQEEDSEREVRNDPEENILPPPDGGNESRASTTGHLPPWVF